MNDKAVAGAPAILADRAGYLRRMRGMATMKITVGDVMSSQ